MNAHRSRLPGDGSFGHAEQMFKWMDLIISVILYTFFDQCDIQNLRNCTEIDGWDSFGQFFVNGPLTVVMGITVYRCLLF